MKNSKIGAAGGCWMKISNDWSCWWLLDEDFKRLGLLVAAV